MGRIITVVVAIASCLLIWQSGALNSILPQQQATVNRIDPGPAISRSGDAMRNLKSLHMSMRGTLLLNGIAGVQITGTGDLTYPHNETLSMQLVVPGRAGQADAIVTENDRIEKGRHFVQYPAQGPAWKDVTSDQKGQVAPGMDPMNNFSFVHAFRASDDLGDITMDNITVHHFSLNVDPGKYVDDLKSDPNSGLTPEEQALLSTAGIQVEVWISPSDNYIHQMRVNLTTSKFSWDLTYHFSKFVSGGGSTGV
ncbi:MAG: hypothetical protein M3077_00495 [Candidatus Dormibacteraeota bacterium]|nr:hypothetical protein [Candidatus Dormibacteraeota bacterium]